MANRMTDNRKSDLKLLARKERNESIVETVKTVCEKFGGQAQIGEGFVIIDTNKFNVTIEEK